VLFSLAGFLMFYTLLLVVELFLMFKYARLGPSSLGTGQYFHEQHGSAGYSTSPAAPRSGKEV